MARKERNKAAGEHEDAPADLLEQLGALDDAAEAAERRDRGNYFTILRRADTPEAKGDDAQRLHAVCERLRLSREDVANDLAVLERARQLAPGAERLEACRAGVQAARTTLAEARAALEEAIKAGEAEVDRAERALSGAEARLSDAGRQQSDLVGLFLEHRELLGEFETRLRRRGYNIDE